ncbi:MAG: hypothetical protein WAV76_03135, partial [Bacteroidota bacterium]
MSEQEDEDLWHYSEQFTKDKLHRSELVTMAWQAREKIGDRRTLGLMRSMMHFRSKELNKRSAFPTKEVGKRTMDAWHHDRVYIDKPGGEDQTLAEFLLPVKITLLDFTITNDFLGSLSDSEMTVLNDLSAGYNMKEISARTSISQSHIPAIRQS